MNSFVKSIVAVTSIGAICTCGYLVGRGYFYNFGIETELDLKTKKNRWSLLGDSLSNYGSNTIGKIYGSRVLAPFDSKNKEKGIDLHKKVIDDESRGDNREIKSNMFNSTSVPHSFSEEQEQKTSLNKVCKKYYEKEMEAAYETDHQKAHIGDEDCKAFWMLCSIWNPKMLDKNSEDYQDNSIGKMRGDELLSAKGDDNSELWKEKNKEFFGLSIAPPEELFQQIYDSNKEGNNHNKLKEKCEEIYKLILGTGQNENIKIEDAVKYCSMKLIK